MKLLIRKALRARGSAEAGVAVLIAALVTGALLGTGLAPTVLSTSDGLTWLGDDQRGEAVQVNPATGQQETRLKVAPPGNQLALGQRDGLLVVSDLTSGTVTVIDVGSLVTGGRWFGSGNGAVKVLLGPDQLYVLDRAKGTIQRLDPTTARPIGAPWTAGGLLVDAAMDGNGTVYALRGDGHLFTLAWSPRDSSLAQTAERAVNGAGTLAVLVSHDVGVTVFAPETGVALQVGTGNDSVAQVGQTPGPVTPAADSPSDLVPVSVTESATVLLFHHGQAIRVDVGTFGCHKPGEPVVYHGRVYVMCPDAGKVLVLGKDGEHLPPDIAVPAGVTKLVKDDGKLFIHVIGADTGLVIGPDGTVTPTETHDESQPPNDPDRPRPVNVPSGRPPGQVVANGGVEPVPVVTQQSPPPAAVPRPPGPPAAVTISAQYEYLTTLRVKVDWAAPADNGNPVNGFVATLRSDRGYSQTFTIAALTTGSVEVACGSRCHGIKLTASVQAVNADGRGPATEKTYTHNAAAQSPLTGDTVVTQVTWLEIAGGFRVTVTMAPPFAWRTYGGTCTVNYSGPASGSVPVACGRATDTFATTFTLITAGSYKFWMQADKVASKQVMQVLFREVPDPRCPRCQIP